MSTSPWADAMKARLRRARMDPPGADIARPLVDQAARVAVMNAMRRHQAPKVQVRATKHRLTVQAQGSGASEVIASVRQDLAAQRHELRQALRDAAKARLRG